MLKNRDRKGRYTKHRKGNNVIPALTALSFIALYLSLGISNVEPTPIVYAAEIIEEEPRVVLIGTKIDWTPERIEEEIRKVFWEEPNTAVAVAKAESELVATAHNPEAHRGCKGSYGIMQIACVHHDTPEDLYDVVVNLEKAHQIYKAQGWQPWGAYTDKRYLQYLE